ncbi:hypothetical protein MASR1M74_06640 [Lentimicrobium sp.]
MTVLNDTSGTLSNRNFYLWMGIILLLAFVMRCYHINFSYSNDELSALSRTGFTSFKALITEGVMVDFHPAGVQVFLNYWVKLFGMDEWIVRLPFVIAGTLGIWLSMLTFARWFGRKAALLAGTMLIFTELSLLYGQIARPYASGFMLSMLTVYFWTLFLQKEKPRYDYALGFAVSAAACLYNHHFSGLFAFITGVTGLFLVKRSHLKLYLYAGVIATLLYVPHLPVTLAQMSVGGVGEWLGKPGPGWPLEHLALLFNNSWIVPALVIIALVMQFRYYKPYADASLYRTVSLVFFATPLLIGYFYSVYINPVLQHSILLFSAPFLFALLFSGTHGMPFKVFNIVLTMLLVGGILQTIFINDYYHKQHFGEFRGIAATVNTWNQKYGKSNITRAMNINNPWYLNFYLQDENPGFVQSENRGEEDLKELSRIINQSTTPYFMYAWLKPTPSEINDIIQARYPCIEQKVDFSGMSTIILYSATLNCPAPASDTLFIMESTFPTSNSDTGGVDYPEFYPGFEGSFTAKPEDESVKLRISALVNAAFDTTRAVLTFSTHNPQETVFWAGSRLEYFVKKNEWSRVQLTIDVPAGELNEHKLKAYLWNPANEPILLRGLCIEKLYIQP